MLSLGNNIWPLFVKKAAVNWPNSLYIAQNLSMIQIQWLVKKTVHMDNLPFDIAIYRLYMLIISNCEIKDLRRTIIVFISRGPEGQEK